MTSFIIGRVVEPAISSSAKGNIIRFGVLNGRTSQEFMVFEYENSKEGQPAKKNPLYDNVKDFKDGETIACIIAHAVSNRNTLGVYLRNAVKVDISFKEALSAYFNG